jgi:cysteine-rich repeat protein
VGTRLHLGFSTAVVLLLLHACGGDSTDDGDSPSGGTSIGTSGGVVTEAGLTLSVPSGAVSTPVAITVEEASTITPPDGLMLVGPAYDLGPDGTQFSKPVLVTIELGSAAAEYDRLTLYHSSDGTSWDPAQNSMYNQPAARITGYISHFSVVAAFASSASGGGGAPGAGGEPQTGGVPGVPAGGVGAGGEPQAGGAGDGSAGQSSACGLNLTDCDGSCVDLLSDPGHCNDCNYSCAGGELCNQGQCAAVDGGGYCGDHMVDAGEECDDGNNTDFDGCSAICTWEAAGG